MANYIPNKAVFAAVLNADVAQAATFTIAYPAGFVQGSFSTGQNQAAVMVVNGNNRYSGAQFSIVFGASNITVTNNTTQTLVAGSVISITVPTNSGPAILIQIPVQLAAIGGNVDVVTAMSPGIDCTLEYDEFIVTTPVTTAAKLATISPFINAVAVTGGAIALTSANATPLGKVIAGSAITALNVLKGSDTLSFKATAVTAFVEGQGVLNVRLRITNPNAY